MYSLAIRSLYTYYIGKGDEVIFQNVLINRTADGFIILFIQLQFSPRQNKLSDFHRKFLMNMHALCAVKTLETHPGYH